MKMSAYNMAGFYAELGDKDRAFAALDEAVNSDQLVGFLKIDPFMKPLRDDPRFQPLLKRVGFPNWSEKQRGRPQIETFRKLSSKTSGPLLPSQ